MNIRFGLDSDLDAKTTYEANFKKAKFLCKDIRAVSTDDILPYVRRLYRRPRLFCACAPCQPFSLQNRNRGDSDSRWNLLGEFHRFVKAYLPEYIFAENVPGSGVPGSGANDERNGPIGELVQFLDDLGYFVVHGYVRSFHYGVPQRRQRIVVFASLLGPIEIPPPTHGPETTNPKIPTVWQWISDLPPIAAGEEHSEIVNHRAARLSRLNLRRISATPEGGGRQDWSEDLWLNCHKNYSGHTDVYGRMVKDKPSPALTTRCISLSNGRFGHPTQNRAISVREAACIQTFPMNFEFHGNLNSMARQIGNAVPVAMARAFGKFILQHYNKYR